MGILALLASAAAATAITHHEELSPQQTSFTINRSAQEQELLKKADKALKTGNYELVLSFANRVVKFEPSDPLYYVLFGECYKGLGKIQEALESYDRALQLDGQETRINTALYGAATRVLCLPDGWRSYVEESIRKLETQNRVSSNHRQHSGVRAKTSPETVMHKGNTSKKHRNRII